MKTDELEASILKALAYLELLIGLLNKLGEGLDEAEIQGLIYVLGDIRTQVLEIKALTLGTL